MKNVLILGVNGFIGNALTERIFKDTNWSIYGMDMSSEKLDNVRGNPKFHFVEGDITINKEWVEYHVKKCDVILPLVAIANPAIYVQRPLDVFELDFEANLEIIRLCVKYNKRVIFPSTSEVYGMNNDGEFDEETSNCVLGPIQKQRWIYSCSKQLIDRVIYAYGERDALDYTLFRPFNWIGPKLDSMKAAKEGSSRVVTQFISNILFDNEIVLVNGGNQSRSFTYIDDGIDALLKIIENKNNCASVKIFNIGNPNNNITIKTLANMIVNLAKQYPEYKQKAETILIKEVSGDNHYGKFYQDIGIRVPSIVKAKTILGWEPKVLIEEAISKTLDYHIKNNQDILNHTA